MNKTLAEAQTPDVLLCGFTDSSYSEVVHKNGFLFFLIVQNSLRYSIKMN